MGIPLQTQSYYSNSGGVDLKSSPTKVAENMASLSLNIDYSVDGAFLTRNGSSILNVSGGIPAQMSGAPTTLAEYDYHKSDGTDVYVVVTSDGYIKTSLTTPANVVTLTSAGHYPDLEFTVTGDDEYLIYGDGVNTNLKFNGTTWTNLSLPRPVAPSAVDDGAGNLSAGTYDYYVSYAVTSDGVIIQESDLSPVGSVTLAASHKTIVTFTACVETLQTGVTAQCNARVLYRNNQTNGVVYRLTTIADNVTLTYNDNTSDADLIDTGIEAEFDNQAAPLSAVFELDDYGQIWYRDQSQLTDSLTSKAYRPWNVPTNNRNIFDAGINCIKRCYGTLTIGTTRSLWVQNGTFDEVAPRRFSSQCGILNNRCAAGQSTLYILGTNKKLYPVTPTDFSQNEMRFDRPLSDLVDPLFNSISASNSEKVCLEYYAKANVAKVVISAPISSTNNDKLLIYNEQQSVVEEHPVWEIWDNIHAACLKQMTVSNEIGLYSGNYNGFLWLLDDSSLNGDGAEENGTVTSATSTVITDSTQTWTVNELVGTVFRITEGYGIDQTGTVTANTATTVTITPALSTVPNTTSVFTVGGYDVYHFCNWKKVLTSYDVLKQLWFIWCNANASGDYTIKLITQYDFDQTINNQTELNISLVAANAIWGSFLWGAAIWGARSVFEDRFRQFARFRAVRFGFMNRLAGQPFQINGFSISCQDKKLFFRSS